MYDEVSVSAVENEGYEFPGASHLIERDPEESGGIAVGYFDKAHAFFDNNPAWAPLTD